MLQCLSGSYAAYFLVTYACGATALYLSPKEGGSSSSISRNSTESIASATSASDPWLLTNSVVPKSSTTSLPLGAYIASGLSGIAPQTVTPVYYSSTSTSKATTDTALRTHSASQEAVVSISNGFSISTDDTTQPIAANISSASTFSQVENIHNSSNTTTTTSQLNRTIVSSNPGSKASVTNGILTNSAYYKAAKVSSSLNQTDAIAGHSSSTNSSRITSTAPFQSCYSVSNSRQPKPANTSITQGLSSTGNATVDQCWMQWSNYWDFQSIYGHLNWLNYSSGQYATTYYADTQIAQSACVQVITSEWTSNAPYSNTDLEFMTETEIHTATIIADGFTRTIETDTHTVIAQEYKAATTITPLSTITNVATSTWTEYSETKIALSSKPSPNCELPPLVTQCQDIWSSWASHQLMGTPTMSAPSCGTVASCQPSWTTYDSIWSSYSSLRGIPSPSCTQASIAEPLCNALRSSYIDAGFSENNGVITSNGASGFSGGFMERPTVSWPSVDPEFPDMFFLPTTTSYLSPTWPRSSTLAAGCTLGCGNCAITGGTVQLIHWLQPAPTPAIKGTRKSHGTVDGAVVASTLGTTFTSPTIYVSLADVHAGDSCSAIAKTHSNTILPLTNTNQLSSIWAQYQGHLSTVSFNFTDLNTPIPASIYTRQPWCAAWTSTMATEDLNFGACNRSATFGRGESTCYPTCPQTQPFNPILVLPTGFLKPIDVAWASCNLDIRGVFDPPIVLTAQSAAALPVAAPITSFIDPSPPAASVQSAPIMQTPAQTANVPSATNDPSAGAGPLPSPSASLISSSTAAAADSPAGSTEASGLLGSVFPSILLRPTSTDQVTTDVTKTNTALDPSLAAEETRSASDPFSTQVFSQSAARGQAVSSENFVNPSQSFLSADPQVPPTQDGGGQSATADPGSSKAVIEGSTPPAGVLPSVPGNPLFAGVDSLAVGSSTTINLPMTSGNEYSAANGLAGGTPPALPADPGFIYIASDGYPSNIPGAIISEKIPAATIAGQAFSIGSDDFNIGGSQTAPSEGFLSGDGILTSIFMPVETIAGQAIGVGKTVVHVGGTDVAHSTATASGITDANQASAAAVTIAGQVYTADSRSGLIIGSNTLRPADPAGTIAGQAISIGSDGVIIGGDHIAYSAVAASAADGASQILTAVMTNGEQVYTADPHSALVVGSSTQEQGGYPATVGGHIVSIGSNGIDIDGSHISYSSPSGTTMPGVALTVGSKILTIASGDPLVIGSQTIQPGDTATVTDQIVDMGSGAGNLGGNSEPTTIASTAPPEAVFGFGSSLLTATLGQPVAIGSTSLIVGSPEFVASDMTFSVASSGVVVDGTIVPFSSSTLLPETEAPLTVSGTAYTDRYLSSDVQVTGDPQGSMTTMFISGAAATIDGQLVSAEPGGLEVGTHDISFQSNAANSGQKTSFTVNGQTYTAVESLASSGTGKVAIVDGSIILPLGMPGTINEGPSASVGTTSVVGNETSTGALSSATTAGSSPASTGIEGGSSGGVSSATTTKSSAIVAPNPTYTRSPLALLIAYLAFMIVLS
ncbi:hypothetical protein EV356DRAFT_533358 [Viridothelium virens]|uniref:Uncharacterized protein n=1 Tax=Viridothelium virens TaxID=1048519 RepID=A0A6A6H7H1_VIRVR|nr:hypothetical protein EV356DRAFT_533358 [Viridothelium virens]